MFLSNMTLKIFLHPQKENVKSLSVCVCAALTFSRRVLCVPSCDGSCQTSTRSLTAPTPICNKLKCRSMVNCDVSPRLASFFTPHSSASGLVPGLACLAILRIIRLFALSDALNLVKFLCFPLITLSLLLFLTDNVTGSLFFCPSVSVSLRLSSSSSPLFLSLCIVGSQSHRFTFLSPLPLSRSPSITLPLFLSPANPTPSLS